MHIRHCAAYWYEYLPGDTKAQRHGRKQTFPDQGNIETLSQIILRIDLYRTPEELALDVEVLLVLVVLVQVPKSSSFSSRL